MCNEIKTSYYSSEKAMLEKFTNEENAVEK